MGKVMCPECKSKNIIPVMYGMPTYEASQAAERGEIKLGGCEVYIDGCKMPDRYCKDCEYEWSTDHFVAEDIVKIRFRYWSTWGCYDPESDEEEQWAYEVFPDGRVKYFAYPRNSRRVLDKETIQISKEAVEDFYNQVIRLYRPWTVIEECRICDGCSYELTITYADNRKKKMTGDLGGGTVDKTVTDFLVRLPFSVSMPEVMPTRDTMSDEQFDSMMSEGLKQAKENNSVSVDKAFDSIKVEKK